MNEASNSILHLHEIDAQVIETEQQLKAYPRRIKALEAEAQGAHTAFDRGTETLRKARAARLLVENEIKQKQETIKKFSAQQMQVKTNKEYEAITHQIQTLKDEISNLESNVIEALDQEEGIEAELERHKQAVRHSDREFEQEKERLSGLEAEKRSMLKKLKAERALWLQKIPEDAMAQYQRASDRYPGGAVVPELNASCGGCHMRLLASTMQQLHEGDSLVPCPHCHRLLYPPEAAKDAHVKLP